MTNRFNPAYFAIFAFSIPCLAGPANAGQLISLCVDAQPHPPYFYADREGSLQLLEKMAAARAGYTLEIHREPNRRCLEDLRVNAIDAVGASAVNTASLAVAIFPRKGGAIDRQRALTAARTVVFRLQGGSALWNGKDFRNLNTRVLIPPGMLLVSQRLEQMGVAYDDGARDFQGIGAKLLAHRAELAIGLEYDVAELQRQDEFAEKIEVLPMPFTETEYYLAFSREFYAKHPEQAENMWNALAAMKRSPEFAAALRRAGLPALDLPQIIK